MLMSRLCVAASNFPKINRPIYLLLQRTAKTKSFDDDLDKPIPLSSTEAASWKASYSRAPPNERVWFTPHIVSFSLASFMIYFCILREENDIDEIIYRPLPQTIKGIDKAFPGMDFETKPDYVRYHEENKKKKMEEQLAMLKPQGTR